MLINQTLLCQIYVLSTLIRRALLTGWSRGNHWGRGKGVRGKPGLACCTVPSIRTFWYTCINWRLVAIVAHPHWLCPPASLWHGPSFAGAVITETLAAATAVVDRQGLREGLLASMAILVGEGYDTYELSELQRCSKSRAQKNEYCHINNNFVCLRN